jgi:hypothetical protein
MTVADVLMIQAQLARGMTAHEDKWGSKFKALRFTGRGSGDFQANGAASATSLLKFRWVAIHSERSKVKIGSHMLGFQPGVPDS